MSETAPHQTSAPAAAGEAAGSAADWVWVSWPGNPRVRAVFTTCAGGVSRGAYACSGPAGQDGLNLGSHVGDRPDDVAENRRRLRQALGGAQPRYLQQVHGVEVADLDRCPPDDAEPVADAACCTRPGLAATVLVADCLPVLFAAPGGRAVAAAHAGWRGLAGGVLEASLHAVCQRAGCAPAQVQAMLGPAIGPRAFEVGDEVRAAFVGQNAALACAFVPARHGKWLADIWSLARLRLQHAGLQPQRIGGGGWCTVSNPGRFFSYRRQTVTGRQAGCVWIV